MTEEEVISVMRVHLEGLFPKACPNCHRIFASLREYLLTTRQVGSSIPYDAELGEWTPRQPIGTMTYANCPCGNTLTLSSEGMPLAQLWSLLAWARSETERRRLAPHELLNYLREKIIKQVLAEPDEKNNSGG